MGWLDCGTKIGAQLGRKIKMNNKQSILFIKARLFNKTDCVAF